MNFGPNFQFIVDYLYFNYENHSRILLNGYLAKKKKNLQRGIRQGDPASGYLFTVSQNYIFAWVSEWKIQV